MSPVSLITLCRRAALGRCPRCGQGGLFKGYLNLASVCPECGLPLERADSGDGPAFILIFVLGFLIVPPVLLFARHSGWPMWLHISVWSSVILAATLGMARPAKALLVGLQYRTKPEMFKERP